MRFYAKNKQLPQHFKSFILTTCMVNEGFIGECEYNGKLLQTQPRQTIRQAFQELTTYIEIKEMEQNRIRDIDFVFKTESRN